MPEKIKTNLLTNLTIKIFLKLELWYTSTKTSKITISVNAKDPNN